MAEENKPPDIYIPGITDIPAPPPQPQTVKPTPSDTLAIPTNPYDSNVTDEEKEQKMFYIGERL